MGKAKTPDQGTSPGDAELAIVDLFTGNLEAMHCIGA